MIGLTSVALRLRWYLRVFGRNALIRRSDRLEALSILAVVAGALFAIPTAVHVGSVSYESTMRIVNEQARDRHSVDAIVVTGSTGMSADLGGPAFVRVQWSEGTRLRTEQVVSPGIVEAGAPLTVWLNSRGQVVAAPLTAADAKVNSVAVSGTVWAMTAVFGALAALAIRLGLDRSRARAWEREIHLLAHNDDGWANRHT